MAYQSWTPQGVLDEIQRLHGQHCRIDSQYLRNEGRSTLYKAGQRYFGNWASAVEAAGFDYSQVSRYARRRPWSKDAVLNEIKKRHANGLSVHPGIIAQEDPPLYNAGFRYFGKTGLRRAVKEVGFGDLGDPKRIWTKETIVEKLVSLVRSGQTINTANIIDTAGGGLVQAATQLFGSMKAALEAAGFDYWKEALLRKDYWTKKRVIDAIKHLKETGAELSLATIKEKHCDLWGAAVRRFGTWQAAVEAAGIDYLQECKTWSTKAWLRKLKKADVVRLKTKTDDFISRHKQHRRRSP